MDTGGPGGPPPGGHDTGGKGMPGGGWGGPVGGGPPPGPDDMVLAGRGGPHGPGVDDPELPAGLPKYPGPPFPPGPDPPDAPWGPEGGPQGTSWGGPPPGVCGGPGEGPWKEPEKPGVPGAGIPTGGPVGVEGPWGVLKDGAGLSTGPGPPPGPEGPGGPPKCPFQPGTGSSNVLANVVAMLGATFSRFRPRNRKDVMVSDARGGWPIKAFVCTHKCVYVSQDKRWAVAWIGLENRSCAVKEAAVVAASVLWGRSVSTLTLLLWKLCRPRVSFSSCPLPLVTCRRKLSVATKDRPGIARVRSSHLKRGNISSNMLMLRTAKRGRRTIQTLKKTLISLLSIRHSIE